MTRNRGDNVIRPAPGGDGLPVLLVEDSQEEVWFWTRALRDAGLMEGPAVVRDGRGAIDYLAGNGIFADRSRFPFPKLMLLDLNLPQLSGFAVLEWWKGSPRQQRLPIVVLTGSAQQADINLAYKLGASSYLTKPSSLLEATDLARLALKFREAWECGVRAAPETDSAS